MFNKLIISGCSNTESTDSWAYVLANILNIEIVNLALGGAGNKHISRSIIHYLEKNKVHKNEALIIVMWSNPFRLDWLREEKFKQYSKHFYGNNCYHIQPGEILKQRVSKEQIQENFPFLLDIAYSQDEATRFTESWESINHFNLYLKNKSYSFCQTFYFDPFNEIPNNFKPAWKTFSNLEHVTGLKLDRDNWIHLNTNEYLGNVACEKNLLKPDYHPTAYCQDLWTRTILIPALKKSNLI